MTLTAAKSWDMRLVFGPGGSIGANQSRVGLLRGVRVDPEAYDIPPDQRRSKHPGGLELSPSEITQTNRPLYMLVVGGLLLVLLVGIAGWLVLAFQQTVMPEGLAVLLGSIAGGLVALITGSRPNR